MLLGHVQDLFNARREQEQTKKETCITHYKDLES